MEFIIDSENAKKRLDIYLSENIKDRTRSYIKTLIVSGNVLVNGKKEKSGYKLKNKDKIVVTIPKDELLDIKEENIPLNIIYEDDDIIIINKEKGMVVHPANGNYTGTVVNSLMYSHKNNLSSINGIVRPGIIVVAKNDNAHKKLSSQFKEHSITRKYIAIVKGIVKKDTMDIDLPIGRSEKDRKKMAVTNKNSKNAVTHIKVLKRFYNSNLTLVEATLETGRTHQIRVHMAYMGYPLLGDSVYGKKDSKFKINGQVLHAKTLGFIHPTTNKYVEFDSNLPKYFEDLIEILEKKEK